MPLFNEKSTVLLDVSFFDENDNPVTPDSATYRIDDKTPGAIPSNIRAVTSIPSLASVIELEVTSYDNRILDDTHPREVRHVTVEFDYGSPVKHGTEEYVYVLKNLFVGATPGVSPSPSASPSVSPSASISPSASVSPSVSPSASESPSPSPSAGP